MKNETLEQKIRRASKETSGQYKGVEVKKEGGATIVTVTNGLEIKNTDEKLPEFKMKKTPMGASADYTGGSLNYKANSTPDDEKCRGSVTPSPEGLH
jgi:hypothetical protein